MRCCPYGFSHSAPSPASCTSSIWQVLALAVTATNLAHAYGPAVMAHQLQLFQGALVSR